MVNELYQPAPLTRSYRHQLSLETFLESDARCAPGNITYKGMLALSAASSFLIVAQLH